MGKLASTQELISMSLDQIDAMSRNDLAKVVTKLNDVATHRMKRMEAKGNAIKSPALEYIKRTGGFEGVRGKDLTEVRNAYMRVKRFLTSGTGNVKGAKEFKKKQLETLARNIGKDVSELEGQLSPAQEKKFWRVIDRAAEAGLLTKSGSEFYKAREVLVKEISQGDKRRGVDTLFDKVFGESGSIYDMYEAEMEMEQAQSTYFDDII